MQEEECQRRDVIILIRRASSRPKNKPALSKVKKTFVGAGPDVALNFIRQKIFLPSEIKNNELRLDCKIHY